MPNDGSWPPGYADLGGDVIKVSRRMGAIRSEVSGESSIAPISAPTNRNKRSVTLDLKSEPGHAALWKLIARTDVLLDNFGPGILDRISLSDNPISALNPRIMHCSTSGFGPTGPYASRPAYDATAQALSGMLSLFVEPESPSMSGPTIADNVTAQLACEGILAALVGRNNGRTVRRVEVNTLDSTIGFMPDPFGYLHQTGLVSDTRLRVRTSQSYAFSCADEKLIAIHLPSLEKFWTGFVEALGRPDLFADPRFNSRTARIEHYENLHEAVSQDFRHRSRAVWVKIFVDADIPVAPIFDVTEIATTRMSVTSVRFSSTIIRMKSRLLLSAVRRAEDQPRAATDPRRAHR